MRRVFGTVAVTAAVLLALGGPAWAQDSGQAQPQAPSPGATAPDPASSKADEGWSGIIYPIYAWLPIYGVETRLPPTPCTGSGCGGDGTTTPEGSTSGNLSGGFASAFRLEKRWFALEGGFLWASLAAEEERPFIKVNVDLFFVDLRAGFEVAPAFYLEGGVRRIALDVDATILTFPTLTWKPGVWEPVVGASYRPRLGKRWRLALHGDAGGLGVGDSVTGVASGNLEWQPAKHFSLVLGGTFLYARLDGKILSKPVQVKQTLYGPVVGIGIPF